jgi:hypothetical protein
MSERLTLEEQEVLNRTIQSMNGQGWGIAFGLMLGIGLFVATNVLVFKGGDVIGPHLGLLSQYFPGYRVTFVGSFVGFAYAFVVGYIAGRTILAIYNRMAVKMG